MTKEQYLVKLDKKIQKLSNKLAKAESKENNFKIRLLRAKIQMLEAQKEEEYVEKTFKEKLRFNFTNQKSNFSSSELIYQLELNRVVLDKTVIKKAKLVSKVNDLIFKRKEKGKGANRSIIRKNIKITRCEAKIIRCTDNDKRILEGNFSKYNFFQRVSIWFKQIPYEHQKIFWGVLFVSPWIIGAMIFFVWPLLTTIVYSFLDLEPLQGGGFATKFIDFDNYVAVFTTYTVNGTIFIQALLSSTSDLLINLPVILIFSLLIAVILNTKFKGSTFIKAIFFIPVVFNSDVISLTLSGQFGSNLQNAGSYFGALNSFKGFLTSLGVGSGIVSFLISSVDRIFEIINLSGVQILLFLSAIQSIPRNLYEAASVEGATKYETFWKITFPMVTPIFLTALVYTIVDSFSTSAIMTYINSAKGAVEYGIGSAISVMYAIVSLAVVGIAFLIMKGVVFYYDER